MKDFKLDLGGDIVLEKGKSPFVSDKDLTVQKVRQTLKTNLGEWKYDEEEGIDLRSIFVKNPNEELIEDIIMTGLLQVDETFRMTAFECVNSGNRHLKISFSAVNDNNEEISLEL